MRTTFALLVLIQLTSILAAQTRPIRPRVFMLPNGPVTLVSSPDKKWTLIFECPGCASESKCALDSESSLSIEDNRTHARRLVKKYERSADISWAPDSRSFFVNDNSGSTDALAYVYDPATLKETDVGELVLARDPEAGKYLGAGHSYLRARRWVSSHELLVVLEGHLDEERVGFYFKYRVHLSGRVHRLYKQISK